MSELGEEFCNFMNACPSPYHFGEYARKLLRKKKFTQLYEENNWDEIPDKGFVMRDGIALIAYKKGGMDSAIAVGTHCDSPSLKLKPIAELKKQGETRISFNLYGSGLWWTWYNRDLRLVGSIFVANEGKIKNIVFDSEEPIATITGSEGGQIIPEINFQPVIGDNNCTSLKAYIAKKLDIKEDDILEWDLSLIDNDGATIVGIKSDIVTSARMDNLSSTFAAIKAFIESDPNDTLNILVVFDHEEIGSRTRRGARGNFLSSFLERLIPDPAERIPFIARSLLVSSDNAHAVHPGFPEKHESAHSPTMGGGVVVKISPGSAYATDLTSAYPLMRAAERSGVVLQKLINRNDIAGGSTIGPLCAAALGMPTVDIGLPQLAMHSIKETLALRDVADEIRLLSVLYGAYKEFRLDTIEL